MIGSGKSRVATFLAGHEQWPLLDCDAIAAGLLRPRNRGWQVIKELDSRFIRADGEVERAILRQAIFADPHLRAELDTRLHPLIQAEMNREIDSFPPERTSHVIIEVPLLFEAGWQDLFDAVICVYAPTKRLLARICDRDGCSRPQAEKAVSSQLAVWEKIRRADHIIDNGASWSFTLCQLLHLITILKRG